VLPIIVIELAISYLFSLLIAKNVETRVSGTLWLVISDFFTSFVVASLCEEGEKLLFAVAVKVDEKDTPYSVFILCVSATLGMATLETVGYTFSVAISEGLEDSFFTSIMRAVLAIPLHASTATLIGAAVGRYCYIGIYERLLSLRKKFHVENKSYLQIMILPLLFHGMYDFGTILGSSLYAQSRILLGISIISAVIVIDCVALALAFREAIHLDSACHHEYSLLSSKAILVVSDDDQLNS
jgi:RsiW-degrading membrane proteinase PrsW (M82 family)